MKDLQSYHVREQIVKAVRAFFDQRRFCEVISPVFNDAVPCEPNIFPFSTFWDTSQGKLKLFLSTSPERHIKKMLSLGVGNCYCIGHSFRNLESSGSLHAPEFLMLEWYRENATYKTIMRDLQKLIIHLKHQVDISRKRQPNNILTYQHAKINLGDNWPVLSLEKLFSQITKLNYQKLLTGDRLLSDYARSKGYNVNNSTWQALFDQVFVNEIEPKLPKKPCFLIDFPKRISPLCKTKIQKSYLSERFEFYLVGIEIANGNNEETDVQKLDFIKDEEFLTSLKTMRSSGKSYAGVGLGLDRLVMIFNDQTHI